MSLSAQWKVAYSKMLQATALRVYSWTVSLPTLSPFWLSWVLGGIASLAMPPFQLWILLPLSFSGFLIVFENTKTPKAAFWLGWVFGFGYFLGGLYWMGYGPYTAGVWLGVPFAVVGLPLGLSFFPAAATLATFTFAKTPLARVFAFTAFWSLSEWLRGHVLTGLPWNLLGYTWDISLLQVTSVIGIYGLSALTTLAACVFATRNKRWVIGVVLGLAVLWVWGDYRITQSQGMAQNHTPEVNMRIVHASIEQKTKWLAEHFQQNLDRYIALSHLPAEKPLAAIIWPESSVTTLVDESSALLNIIAQAAPEGGTLLFGAPREVKGHLRTSMMALNDHGKLVGVYDKSHLVPFGEYMPLRSIITIKKLTYGDRDYTPGVGIQTLSLPGLPKFSPLICYEAIFPHAVIDGNDRPYWMLNLTNDAWFGHSSGPYQHLQSVRVRAIEEGIPLIRSANNGISAVVNSFGKVLHRLEINEIGFIDFSLPNRSEHATLYQRWGDLPFFGILLVLFGLMLSRCPFKIREN